MNLSSDSSDEEEGFDDWARVNLRESRAATSKEKMKVTSDDDDDSCLYYGGDNGKRLGTNTVAFFSPEDINCYDSEVADPSNDDDDDDAVDWEDAIEEHDGAGDGQEGPSKLAADNDNCNDTKQSSFNATVSHLKPVTIDWDDREGDNHEQSNHRKKKKNRIRRSYRYESLPPNLKRLLLDLERTHLLSLTSHAMYVSKSCSDHELLHLSHSLALPEQYFLIMTTSKWMDDNVLGRETSTSFPANTIAPTYKQLVEFCNWYFDLINSIAGRRRNVLPANHTAGAPTTNRRQRNRRRVPPTGARRKGRQSTAYMVVQDPSEIASSFADDTIVDRTRQFCKHLSRAFDEDPQLRRVDNELVTWNDTNKVVTLVSMARSFGWRARFVIALTPIKKDLDVEHPLLHINHAKNIFQQAWNDIRRKKVAQDYGGGKPPAKEQRIQEEKENSRAEATATNKSSFFVGPTNAPNPVVWAEILCEMPLEVKRKTRITKKNQAGARSRPTKMRWIHVDPCNEFVNQPSLLENLLLTKQEGLDFRKSKRKVPVSYCLAAEHVEVDNCLRCRLTDVTPRYASSWVETLRSRGVLRGKQTKVDDKKRTDLWWNRSLKCLDGVDHEGETKKSTHASRGKSAEDAIALHEDSNDEEDHAELAPKTRNAMREVEDHEKEELSASVCSEPIPTSKTAFKSHPMYVIPSILNSNEVLVPDSKSRICGVFKGEMVYRRSDVKVALPVKRWLYRRRKVKDNELSRPVKRIKARRKSAAKTFIALKSYGVGDSNDGSEEHRYTQLNIASQPLEDGMENVYAPWQTEPWNPPPVGPGDPIPVNEHNNVDLQLLNPGLVHIMEPRISKVAKKLGMYVGVVSLSGAVFMLFVLISMSNSHFADKSVPPCHDSPYAPCLLGFEGHSGNRTPTVRGIVVHETNEILLREAHVEMTSQLLEESHSSRQQAAYRRWKKLLVAVLTKHRLERQYGDGE